MVRVSNGTTYDEEKGDFKLNRVILGYYSSKKEALEALAQYNKSPYDLSQNKITFGEIYKKIADSKFSLLSPKTQTSYNSAYKHCAGIANIPIRDLKTAALQKIFDECEKGSRTKDNMRTIMNAVFEYAMQNDLVDKNYTEFVTFSKTLPVIERIPYSDSEIQNLWDIEKDRFEVKIILILLYTGMRINELLTMKRNCCHLDEHYLDITASKTRAGIRKVPIHNRILPLVTYFYEKGGEYLIVRDTGNKITYANFLKREYSRLNADFGTQHHFHDTRHTFITRAHQCRLDDYCIKKIVGHAGESVTQNVYTHIDVPELLLEINKIP